MISLEELLGIEYPIIQGGMARVAKAPLVAAVSEAGGLGVLGGAAMTPEELRDQIREVRRNTSKPFGVNLMLQSEFWQDQIKVVLEEKPPVITTGAGNPSSFMKTLKEKGIKILPLVGSANQALLLEKAGADGVIAEGKESGGHIGDVTTIVLVNAVLKSVTNIPVIAAGGIVDKDSYRAMRAMGAAGVQMGTRFVASEEAPISPAYKDVVLKANERSTVEVGRRFKHAVRIWRNQLAQKLIEAEYNGDEETFSNLMLGALIRAVEGDLENGAFMMGQSAGLIKEILPVKDIIKSIAA
ncbi:MAG TPA: nitronate monooxygenase [Coprothermobacter proteolyticus]|uniref:NAD(P)H-dependent flavin oxidoreductase n=1 Tax=Coprothermobacter proteolyticus TaxID=35786 RepID=UPI000D32124F|nr:nitronate monooxygenase [Coprothermobacter proteolyticus]MBK6586037.1 nitronate monooxygenase [Coprothermobacter sp.]MBP8983542.1 nitronate monooxygenase [Coprothermobacter sp.]HOK24699.1 nitronate monooxygenase [Coprothermobacter proteolyticus]HPZ44981.1 nitronate monooxygenase [Coprothermobacter proteolyticus]HQD07635.1 nitronate monooxygenase [Coprothermobacter proteolyticus]